MSKPVWNEVTLSNGLSFLYCQNAGVPLAAGTMLFRAGSANEQPQKAGLAGLTADLLLQGTRRRSAVQLALEIESIGGALGFQASEDYADLSFVAPTHELDQVLDVVCDVLSRPRFASEEVKKEKASVIAALKGRQDTIFNVAYDAMTLALFGDHPYSRPVEGKSHSVAKFQQRDFRAWHQTYYQPDQAIFSLVSSPPASQIQRQVEKRLGQWKAKRQNRRSSDGIKRIKEPRSIKLRSRFEQAYLMTGVYAPAVQDPDYLTVKVLNTLFGGGMSSRLFLRLREELGLAYEVSSFSPTHLMLSHWICYMGTPPDKLALAKSEMEKLLHDLQNAGPTSEEVNQAVAMIKGSFLLEQQTRRRQAWYAAWWKFLGRPLNYAERFMTEIDRVTREQTQAAARRLLAQPRVSVEVVPR